MLKSLSGSIYSPQFIYMNEINEKDYIIMELLGEDMGTLRQISRQQINDNGYLIQLPIAIHLAKEMINCIEYLHHKGYIHRDIKLENMMFLDKYENSPVKIIDMGSMTQITCQDGIYRDCNLVGTSGFIAPESVQYFDYSYASDIWQLGCCLYSMLSGHSPFGSNNYSTRFLPMSGVAWNNISYEAKDLVRRMLQKSVPSRITLTEILQHPWMINDKLPTCFLTEDYYVRMKYLALRQQMKLFFLDSKVIESNRDRRKKLKKLIPMIRQSSSLSSSHSQVSVVSQVSFSTSSAVVEMLENQKSITSFPSSSPQLKSSFSTPVKSVQHPGKFIQRSSSIASPETSPTLRKQLNNLSSVPHKIIEQLRNQNTQYKKYSPIRTMTTEKLEIRLESFRIAVLRSLSTSCESMTYELFRSLMIEAELGDLSSKRVFNIFDLDRTGTIDMRDFLLTMAALNFGRSDSKRLSVTSIDGSNHSIQSNNSNSSAELNESSHDSLAQLYFSIFDISGRGYIEFEQFKMAIDYIIYHDDEELGAGKNDLISPRKSRDEKIDVEMLFATIDSNNTGKIDFGQFSKFFNKLRSSTI